VIPGTGFKILPSYQQKANPRCGICGHYRFSGTPCQCDTPEWEEDHSTRDAFIQFIQEVFREVYRVLKPGAHGFVWAIPRTSHWTAMGLENAGFEVRDVANHIFGTGWPKTLDLPRAIDKALGHLRPPGDPITEEAKQWQGFSTGLKPAHEHWILVRKPISGTVTETVLRWGTGALNIDACRVEREASDEEKSSWPSHLLLTHSPECKKLDEGGWECAAGCPVIDLDQQSGVSKSEGGSAGAGGQHGIYNPIGARPDVKPGYGDVGGASRYFETFEAETPEAVFKYQAKASTFDKTSGLSGFYWKKNSQRPSGYERVDEVEWKKLGEEEDRILKETGKKVALRAEGNVHPTPKPVALMSWFARLVTPPGGTLLDCFMGSGSTGVACVFEGLKFVGIDRDPDYFQVAKARIDYAKVRVDVIKKLDAQPKPEATPAPAPAPEVLPGMSKLKFMKAIQKGIKTAKS
jgi:site-specific DNA-methyltransferase (adenine-specific)